MRVRPTTLRTRLLILLFLLPCCCRRLQAAAVRPGATLVAPEPGGATLGASWISPSGNFSLGFISFVNNSNSYYVGVQYANLRPFSRDNVIWVANRKQAVGGGSTLSLSAQDGLQLRTASSALVWQSTLAGNQSQLTEGEMLESGNFVLRNAASEVVWDTFSSPTDTVLTAQNLTASNSTVATDARLVAWAGEADPSAGSFSLAIQPSTPGGETAVRLVYAGNNEYWSRPGDSFGVEPNGSFAVYNATTGALLWADGPCGPRQPYNQKITLGVDGNLRILQWSQTAGAWQTLWRALFLQCGVYNTCGNFSICSFSNNGLVSIAYSCPLFDPSPTDICFCPPQGFRNNTFYNFSTASSFCVPLSTADNCSTTTTALPGVVYGDPYATPVTYSEVNQSFCRDSCVDNCSCTTATYSTVNGSCWHSQSVPVMGIQNGASTAPITTFLRIASSSSGGRAFPMLAKILIGLLGFIIIASITATILVRRKGRTKTPGDESRSSLMALLDLNERAGSAKWFSLSELSVATNGFSDDRKLGAGGFGSVYKGVLTMKKKQVEVAVKRLTQNGRGNRDDFLTEVEALGAVRHVNVVLLLGYGLQGAEKFLVYEMMRNGSVEDHLFGKQRSRVLSWEERMQIVVEAARGIDYLHTQCPRTIIHRDIKPANILLDSAMHPKVGDFGIAKFMDHVHSSGTKAAGTPAYMAPECWYPRCPITPKADVYSFGITILEIVSGRRVRRARFADTDSAVDESEESLYLYLEDAISLTANNRFSAFVDERLRSSYSGSEVERLVRVALHCLNVGPDSRPSMNQVVLNLMSEYPSFELPAHAQLPLLGCVAGHGEDGHPKTVPHPVELSAGR